MVLHSVIAVCTRAVSAVRTIAARIRRVHAEVRLHRRALEIEVYGGRYRLRCKADDDLPIAS